MSRTRWRTIGSIFGGILAGLLLFLFTGNLIDGDHGRNGAAAAGQIVGLVRIQEEDKVRTKVRTRIRKPEPRRKPPPVTELDFSETVEPAKERVRIDFRDIEWSPIGGGEPYPGRGPETGPARDADAAPYFRIEAEYPREALVEGIEGHVRLTVLIGTDGSVVDIKIIEAVPGRIFVRNAIRAVRHWKFKPRIVNGKPMERWASTNVVFELDD